MIENLDPNWLGNGSEEDEIYKENILEHFRNPRNFGKLSKYDIHSQEFNHICGDQIELFIKLDNNKVEDVKFLGKGCAISMASASMFTEKIKNLTLDELKKIKEQDILEMIGVPLSIIRRKCGLLPLQVLKEGIYSMEVENEQINN